MVVDGRDGQAGVFGNLAAGPLVGVDENDELLDKLRELGIDVLISAPQKGWSAQPCAGLVMLSERGVARLGETQSDSPSVSW